MATVETVRAPLLRDPRWVQLLFSSTEYAWVWLIARVYLGWEWWSSGWGKTHSDAWMGGGAALKTSWERMITIPQTGRPVVAYDWYREFIEFMYNSGWWTWFAKLVAFGELVVGIALILGLLTGLAALFGGFMNWNFAMGGLGAGTNAIMIIIAVGIFMAWKTAGWWGLDRWLLPALGTPWQAGTLFGRKRTAQPANTRPQRPMEQWIRMLTAVGVAIYALAMLSGPLQVAILLITGLFVAATGMGWFSVMKAQETRGQSRPDSTTQ